MTTWRSLMLWVKKHLTALKVWCVVSLSVLFALLFRRRSPVTAGRSVEDKAAGVAGKKLEAATKEYEKRTVELTEAHDKEVAAVVTSLQKETEEVRDDVEATNEYLKKVGSAVRGIP